MTSHHDEHQRLSDEHLALCKSMMDNPNDDAADLSRMSLEIFNWYEHKSEMSLSDLVQGIEWLKKEQSNWGRAWLKLYEEEIDERAKKADEEGCVDCGSAMECYVGERCASCWQTRHGCDSD